MNTKAMVSMAAAAVAAVSLVLAPASADSKDEAVAVQAVAVLAAAETPADEVWDMTYGPDKPVLVAQDDSTIPQEEETVDLSMG